MTMFKPNAKMSLNAIESKLLLRLPDFCKILRALFSLFRIQYNVYTNNEMVMKYIAAKGTQQKKALRKNH